MADAVADRLPHRLGLLVDLLEHEGLVAALLRALDVPVDLDHVAVLGGAVVEAVEGRALGRDRDDLVILDELDLPRLRQEGRDRGGEERLALPEPDHERALEARADELVRVVVVDGDEREVALELRVRGAHRVDEVALVVALDQVDDDLGVRLGAEAVAVGLKRLLQLAVVLDDPVQDDRDLVVRRTR